MKTIYPIAVLISALVFSGCTDRQADRLLGTWQTQLIPSEWGSNRITMTFLADGRMAGTNAFLEGEALAWHGTYRVQGNVIHRTIETRTQEIGFRISGDSMHMTIGNEDYTFRQVMTEPDGASNGLPPAPRESMRTSPVAGSPR
jgi:uncharacterized protein (TIGR03066 family)